MTKLFADLELKKQKMEEAEGKERKRERDEADAIAHKAKKEKEWKEEWEVCWHNMVKGHCHYISNINRPVKLDGWTAGEVSRRARARKRRRNQPDSSHQN